MTDLEKILEIACEACGGECEKCTRRKECEEFQNAEDNTTTLKLGMVFEGVAEWNKGEWIRIISVTGNRVRFNCCHCKDSCDIEFFPAIEYPEEWKFSGYTTDEFNENAYILAF